jgi:hypothetical protein
MLIGPYKNPSRSKPSTYKALPTPGQITLYAIWTLTRSDVSVDDVDIGNVVSELRKHRPVKSSYSI